MEASPVPARTRNRRTYRYTVVAFSVAMAIVGVAVLVTRDTGEQFTTQGVTATLQVGSHPGWVVAGRDAIWLAVNGERGGAPGEKPLERLDLATGLVEQAVPVGGEASFLARAGNRLFASVRHVGQDELGGRLLFALDWQSGRVLVQRGFDGPVDHVAPLGRDLWALETRPGTLLRLDQATLAPKARPLRLSSGRTLDVTSGGGYLWVTAPDTGEILRIDPATRAILRIHVGGAPIGIAVTGRNVWFADRENGDVVRRALDDLQARGTKIHVGGKPTWVSAAGGSLFVSDAESGSVLRVDARSGKRVGLPVRIAPPAEDAVPFPIASAGNSVWVSSFASNTVTRISAAPSSAPSATVLARGAEPSESADAALPAGGKIVAHVSVPAGSGSLAVGEGAVWVFSDDASELLRIDPRTNAIVARIEIPETSGDAAAGAGAVWISHPATDKVSRVDPVTNTVTATIPVREEPAGLAVSSGAVWVANMGGPSVSRIDPATNKVVATIRVGPAQACCSEHMSVTARNDAVWVGVPNANTIVRVDPATNRVTNTVKMPYSPCAFLVADSDSVWNAGGGCGDFLARIDARTRKLTTTVQGEPHPVGLALYDGSLWVAALHAPSVDRVDPHTGRLLARLPTGGSPLLLDSGFGAVWVYDDMGRGILRIEPQD